MTHDEKKMDNLCDAIHEAERFIAKAKAALKRLQEDRYASIVGSKETAAAKRSSMDLSRALVEVRS